MMPELRPPECADRRIRAALHLSRSPESGGRVAQGRGERNLMGATPGRTGGVDWSEANPRERNLLEEAMRHVVEDPTFSQRYRMANGYYVTISSLSAAGQGAPVAGRV